MRASELMKEFAPQDAPLGMKYLGRANPGIWKSSKGSDDLGIE